MHSAYFKCAEPFHLLGNETLHVSRRVPQESSSWQRPYNNEQWQPEQVVQEDI